LSLDAYYLSIAGVAVLMAVVMAFQTKRGPRRFVFSGAWLVVAGLGLALQQSAPIPVLGILMVGFIGLVFYDSVLRQRGTR